MATERQPNGTDAVIATFFNSGRVLFSFCSIRLQNALGSPVIRRGAGMNTKTHFPFRIDVWDDHADGIVRHVAGIDDYETAVATYWAACHRWPKAKITLRQGARIIEKSWAAS